MELRFPPLNPVSFNLCHLKRTMTLTINAIAVNRVTGAVIGDDYVCLTSSLLNTFKVKRLRVLPGLTLAVMGCTAIKSPAYQHGGYESGKTSHIPPSATLETNNSIYATAQPAEQHCQQSLEPDASIIRQVHKGASPGMRSIFRDDTQLFCTQRDWAGGPIVNRSHSHSKGRRCTLVNREASVVVLCMYTTINI